MQILARSKSSVREHDLPSWCWLFVYCRWIPADKKIFLSLCTLTTEPAEKPHRNTGLYRTSTRTVLPVKTCILHTAPPPPTPQKKHLYKQRLRYIIQFITYNQMGHRWLKQSGQRPLLTSNQWWCKSDLFELKTVKTNSGMATVVENSFCCCSEIIPGIKVMDNGNPDIVQYVRSRGEIKVVLSINDQWKARWLCSCDATGWPRVHDQHSKVSVRS